MTDQQAIIIRKSDDDHHDDHHGGGWKVAYADFMTAMMAFFLLLWIVSASDEQKLRGLAEYFTPSMTKLEGGGLAAVGSQSADPGAVAGAGTAGAPDLPSFGQDSPLAVFDSRMREQAPEVVVEYEPQDPEALDPEAQAELEQLQQQRAERTEELDQLEQEIAAQIASMPELADLAENLRFDRTSAGLLVQIMDKAERPMFASGSAEIGPQTQELLEIVGRSILDMAQPLVISGHTDALPFKGRDDYGNWELSSDRANATRRALISAGVQAERISKVSGLADTEPLFADRPDAPQNRRISVLLEYPEPGMTSPVLPQGQ